MASPTSILSRTVQSISLTKIKELDKQRDKYTARKSEVLAAAAAHPEDIRERIKQLLQGLQELYPEAINEDKQHRVPNVRHWVKQSVYDASVPEETLRSAEDLLRDKLEVQSRRLNLAHLYSRLVTEWMDPSSAPMCAETASGGSQSLLEDQEGIGGSFEVVEDRQKQRLQELCDKFERVVFEPLDSVDEQQIERYLQTLFDSDDASKALKSLKRRLDYSGKSLINKKAPFDEETLKWCITGLLAEDLLSDEKQAILRDFLENKVVMSEICDVLNMRYTDFENWEWQAGEEGIPVLPRQQLNGKYRIWMDEDVLQAIFIHYVGIVCCVDTKRELAWFLSPWNDYRKVWTWEAGPKMSKADKLRRTYYLSTEKFDENSIETHRKSDYMKYFFLSQLPSTVTTIGSRGGGSYDDDGGDEEDHTSGKPATENTNIKQLLLRNLATDAILHRSLHGEAAVVQSDLQWFATGLSHTTIFIIMRFFGFPETLIAFFKKVLEAPLNVVRSPEDTSSSGPRVRKRGVPMAHAVEKFLGELVLFVMDLAVNKESGMLLYRLHDDLWLCGSPERCSKAWKAMQSFAKVMGLEFNMHKTGSVYLGQDDAPHRPDVVSTLPKGIVRIGHLILDPTSGEWVLDQEQVTAHITQLEKQLGACTSVLDWVRTWNSCMGRFFGHTFGEPAHCFGKKHVESILKTYQSMQNSLFSTPVSSGGQSQDSPQSHGNVVRYLKDRIQARFGVSDIPDAFIFLPERLGGLGLRNPFISMVSLLDGFTEGSENPEDMMRRFYRFEKDAYDYAKKRFETEESVDKRLRQITWKSNSNSYEDKEEAIFSVVGPEERDKFFSFEEYTRWRETADLPLSIDTLLRDPPETSGPDLDDEVDSILRQLRIQRHGGDAKTQEIRWALQMYSNELNDKYGGLRLLEEKYLPLGLLGMMRKKAVRWNMVL